MQVEAFNWKKSQPLAEDYMQRTEKAGALFDFHYLEPEDWDRRAVWLQESKAPKADRKQLIRVLSDYNRRVGNAQQALEAIALLDRPDSLAVIGGQQAGLFGGPLLVLYKAITLLQLAKESSARLKRPVVPVFWIAGEDHDFDEVNHIHYLSGQQTVEKLKVDHPTGQRTSISRLPLSADAWEEALHRLEATLTDTEYKGDLLQKLRNTAAGSATLSDAFARWMSILFGEYGLVLMDSDDRNVRQLESAMFEQLIRQNPALNEALNQGRSRVEEAGYIPQVDVQDHAANLFVFEGDQRLLLYRDGEIFSDKKKDYKYSEEQLLELSRHSPEKLSNNVMTRPLMQEYLFPVLATVLGSSEIAYWGLTKDAFRLYGMRMPIIAPRLEFTLVEGTVQKHMAKYDVSFEDVISRFDEKKQAWLDDKDTFKLADRFTAVKASFHESYAPLVESLGSINPGVKNLGETNLAKIMEQIEYLEAKAGDAHKTAFDSSLRQLDRIRLSIIPLAKPQERVYNICAYLNRYGDDWLRQLVESTLPVDGLHRIYYL